MNKTLRKGLFGAVLVLAGFLFGQPAFVAVGVKNVTDTISEVSHGATKSHVEDDSGK